MTESIRITERDFELEQLDGQIRLGENVYKVEPCLQSENKQVVRIDNRIATLYTVRTDTGVWVFSRGRARFVEDLSKSGSRRKSKTGQSEQVTPQMPGVVVNVLVSVGEAVTKGQGLVVVSAMKMEAVLAAPFNGVVEAVNVEAGDKVSPGEILVDVTRDAQGGDDE